MAENKGTTAKAASKSTVLQELANETGLSRKQVAGVFDALGSLIKRELGKKGPGVFTIPGLLKLKLKRTKAKPARKGINPFTKEEVMFKAKPASNSVKALPLKNLKEMVK